MVKKETTYVDWGDGTIVEVKRPVLDLLKAVVCSCPCNPEGEDPDDQVKKPKQETPKPSQ